MNNNQFDITGNDPTTAGIDAEFAEFTVPDHLGAIREEHEPFLTKLEALAVLALASGSWGELYDFITWHQAMSEGSQSAIPVKSDR